VGFNIATYLFLPAETTIPLNTVKGDEDGRVSRETKAQVDATGLR
jgi:hypothetical protein